MEENKEKVLCVSRSALPESWLQDAAGIKMQARDFYECLEGVPVHWMPRHAVEKDRSYKQLIPYVVLQTVDGFHTACYRRNGTETRLHDLWSVGIGGHINVADCPAGEMALPAVVNRGMDRELNEEFQSLPVGTQPVFRGVINEEETSVGHVHLGLVYRVAVTDMNGFVPGRELDAFCWLSPEEIFLRPLEIWSRLAINLLDEKQ